MEPAAQGRGRQGKLARTGLYGAVLTLLAAPALAAPLQVVINGVQNSKGTVMVAVCSEREFLGQTCMWNGRAPARPGPVLLTIEVPPGTYAVQAYQDEDNNGQVTLSMLGIPTEPMGFSNNPTVRFSAPSFRQCAIAVGPMGGRIEVTLKQLL